MLAPLLLAALAAAQPEITVVQATGEIRVDGRLDEADWERAQVIDHFEQFLPTYGGPPPGTTEVRILQDERHLYLAIRVTGVDYPLRARMAEREYINSDDQIGIYLDTFYDGQSGYIFYLNALGVQQDMAFHAGNWNSSWDAVFHSKGRVTEDGYELEVGFPYRSLKYPSGQDTQVWGLMLTRKIPALGTKYSWPRMERNHPQFMTQALPMRGVEPPSKGSGLELIPSVTAVAAGSRDNPYEPMEYSGLDPWHEAVRPSLDARFGITPNIGLTAAINPDFSQVEADVTQISLNQRFAYWYGEKRPFFLEGAGYFSDRPGTLYSRSIQDPIYGVKVAGQEGAWSVGVLHAEDRAPAASVNENGAPGFDSGDVTGASADNTLLRVRMEAVEDGWVGFTLADKRLRRPTGTIRSTNDVVGMDAYIPLGGRWWGSGHAFQSFTGHDGDKTLSGQNLSGAVGRNGGEGVGFRLGAGTLTPGHRRETGYLTQAGLSSASLYLDYTFEPEAERVDQVVPSLSTWATGEVNDDHHRGIHFDNYTLIQGVHGLSLWGGYTDVQEDGAQVDELRWGTSYSGVLGSAVTLSPSLWGGRIMDYDNLAPARSFGTALGAILRPFGPLRIDVNLRYEQLDPESADREHASRQRVKLRYQFTQALGMRLIVEHVSGTEIDPLLSSSALLRWLETPGTAFYLGYGQTDSLVPGERGTLERTVFAKASVLLRP